MVKNVWLVCFFQKQTKKENRITTNKSVITNYIKNENFKQIQLPFIFFNLFQEIKKTSNSSIKYQQTDKADTDARKINKIKFWSSKTINEYS